MISSNATIWLGLVEVFVIQKQKQQKTIKTEISLLFSFSSVFSMNQSKVRVLILLKHNLVPIILIEPFIIGSDYNTDLVCAEKYDLIGCAYRFRYCFVQNLITFFFTLVPLFVPRPILCTLVSLFIRQPRFYYVLSTIEMKCSVSWIS